MSKYRLSVDETRNTLKYVDIETELSEKEVDLLLNKIENDNEIICGEDLAKALQVQGVKVNTITSGTQNYYIGAETIEIEELKEPEKFSFTVQFKACDLNQQDIEQAIEMARKEMIESIDTNGLGANITIQLSQELDALIVAEMRSRL